MDPVCLTAVPDFPDVREGDDIGALLMDSLTRGGIELKDGDVIALAHKVVSKAEGRTSNLEEIIPGKQACEVAAATNKDPRLVELILSESDEISRMRAGVLIVRHRLGFTSANAGIDRSNVPQGEKGEWVVLLPVDPDSSAARIAKTVRRLCGLTVGILIVDSHGRPFRMGTVGVAIGSAGIPVLWDRRGEVDRYGYQLHHTEVATADEIAAAASLLMGQASEGRPAIVIRGLQLPPIEGKTADLIRSKEMDLYR
jgi:coenzyme F420-0:L-glutamate ligase/coenzyme F420-1:gamma-L-glutamate ligase